MEQFFKLLPGSSSSSGAEETLMDAIHHHILDSEPWIRIPKLFGVLDISITKHVVIIWIVAALLILIVLSVAKAVKKDKSAIGGRLSTLVQIFLEFISNDIIKANFRADAKKYLPYFCTLFFFIMLSNLFGTIPGSATVTGNLAVPLSLAGFTLFFIFFYGMIKHGIFKFWPSIVPSGIPKFLWPLMFVIELVSFITKTAALTIRLFANMIAGHIVILVFLFLTKLLFVNGSSIIAQIGVPPITVIAALSITLLEIFIAVLQAYIFTFLSAIFISDAGHSH